MFGRNDSLISTRMGFINEEPLLCLALIKSRIVLIEQLWSWKVRPAPIVIWTLEKKPSSFLEGRTDGARDPGLTFDGVL